MVPAGLVIRISVPGTRIVCLMINRSWVQILVWFELRLSIYSKSNLNTNITFTYGIIQFCLTINEFSSVYFTMLIMYICQHRIIGIGIGYHIDEQQLAAVVSQPIMKHMFTVDQFDQLNIILDR